MRIIVSTPDSLPLGWRIDKDEQGNMFFGCPYCNSAFERYIDSEKYGKALPTECPACRAKIGEGK